MALFGEWKPYGGVDPQELNSLANKLLVASVVLLVLPLLASVSRAATTGWVPIYTYHVIAYLLVLLAAIFRQRLDGRLKVLIIIVGCFLVVASGHYSYGLYKGGAYFLPISLILIVFFFGPAQMVALFAVTAIGYSFVASQFLNGNLQADLTLAEVNFEARYWLSTGFSLVAFFTISGLIMFGYRKLLAEKVRLVSAQRDEIERLTKYCSVTGAATRFTATEKLDMLLAEAKEEHSQGALLLVVIENLAKVNNEQGYDVGEMALRQTGERLRSLMRPDDFLARVGGTRFLMILPRVKNDNRAEFMAEQIRTNMKTPVRSSQKTFEIQCSIGIAHYPVEELDAKQLILLVNEAALAARRDGVEIFQLL